MRVVGIGKRCWASPQFSPTYAVCEQYWRAMQVGEPSLLTGQEMAEVFERFKGYGKWSDPEGWVAAASVDTGFPVKPELRHFADASHVFCWHFHCHLAGVR